MVRPPIAFYAFDLLRLNGQDLRGLPVEERKSKLAALLKNPPPGIRYSASFTENIDQLLTKVRELSLEGLIGKARRLQIRFQTVGRVDQDQDLPARFLCDRRLYPAWWRTEIHGRVIGRRL
jgi:ATP-dependent DNA ligase